jgi:hypothetical protein
LENKLRLFQHYFNRQRVHSGLGGRLPDPDAAQTPLHFSSYRWQQHCRGLYQTPIASDFQEFAYDRFLWTRKGHHGRDAFLFSIAIQFPIKLAVANSTRDCRFWNQILAAQPHLQTISVGFTTTEFLRSNWT